MKSPFIEFVVQLHEEGLTPEKIFELSKAEFSKSTVCFFQVERAINNYRNGLVTKTGEVILHAN